MAPSSLSMPQGTERSGPGTLIPQTAGVRLHGFAFRPILDRIQTNVVSGTTYADKQSIRAAGQLRSRQEAEGVSKKT